MSGHSKWSSIKRQKGITDAKRGQAFTKLANLITIAVGEGGGSRDPDQNFKLRLTVEKARAINMPKENIERAIERGLNKGGGENEMYEAVYEGFGPEKVAIMVEAATDNKARTTTMVKNVFEKNGGIIGQPGTVSYQFRSFGTVTIKKQDKTFDDLFLQSADAGAEDVIVGENDDEAVVLTQPNDLAKVREALLAQNIPVVSAELTRRPTVTVQLVEDAQIERVQNFIEKLEDLDDVQKVYVNVDTGSM